MSRPTKQVLDTRKTIFHNHLVERTGSPVEYGALIRLVKDQQSLSITDRACRDLLEKMRSFEWPPGTHLVVGSRTAELRVDRQTTKDERDKQRPNVKHGIGRALWEILFTKDTSRVKELAVLQPLLARLRSKSLVNCLIDAGSTTQAVAEQLLALEMPLGIKSERDPQGGPHLVSFRLVTNSPPLANMACRSNRRHLVDIVMIGGEIRVDRESICGLMADAYLSRWDFSGDIAVVGTTGYRDGKFTCDDFDEAQLKAWFLDRAAILRALVFDSNKFRSPVVFKSFAPLAKSTVDLVVTDDGGDDEELQSLVKKFRHDAKHAGVATYVVEAKNAD